MVLNTSDPVLFWLPIVLLLVLAKPFAINIPTKGDVVLVPEEVTPVKLTEETVLLFTFEIIPVVIPL